MKSILEQLSIRSFTLAHLLHFDKCVRPTRLVAQCEVNPSALNGVLRTNNLRIEFLNERLEATRERLTNQFVRAELAIGKIQGDLAAISAILLLPALTTNLRSG